MIIQNKSETYNEDLHASVTKRKLWNSIKEISGMQIDSKFDISVMHHIEELLEKDVQQDEIAFPNAVNFLLNTSIIESI